MMVRRKGEIWTSLSHSIKNRLGVYCLELESYIRSDATHGIYKLDGEVPKMIMSRDMSDIPSFVSLNGFTGDAFRKTSTIFR